jgi:ribose/xylose/arabinose/galactoside ABC-type transport system permease subunit
MEKVGFNLGKKVKTIAFENPLLLFLIVSFIGSFFLAPNFATQFNLTNLLLQFTDLFIVSCGVTFIVLNGGIDFSATAVLSLGSVIGAYIMALSPLRETVLAVPVGILAMVGVGCLMGLINGFAVVILKIPSFIATLATMMIGNGIAVWFTSLVAQRASIYGLPEVFFKLGGDGGMIYVPVIIAIIVLIFSYWLLKFTLFGRRVYAVAINPKASFISGILVKRTIFLLCLLSGLYGGLASVIITARNQAGIPTVGDKVFIDIIASIIIGGNSIFGGFGGAVQTLLGVLFITLMNNVMNLFGVDWYAVTLVKGIFIFIAAFSDFFIRRRAAAN